MYKEEIFYHEDGGILNDLLKEVMMHAFLETFKVKLGKALSNLI